MPFQVTWTPSAEADLSYFRPYEQRLIIDGIKRHLRNDADVESKRRKRLRDNPMAPWEPRIGKYRVFYDLAGTVTVKIVAVGYKEHNELLIQGRRVEI